MKPRLKKGQPPEGCKKGFRCETRYCRGRKALKADGYLLRHCWKCRSRMFKASRPLTYVLRMLRQSAKRRNLAFTLTLTEFRWFCLRTGYLELRGNKPGSLTVDRIDHRRGYHADNIQTATHAENSRAGYCYPGGQVHQNHRRAKSEPF